MKILILPDLHFGFGQDTERFEDSFEYARQALSEDADLVFLAGDIFDSRTPSTEVFVKALSLFLEPHLKKDRIEGISGINKNTEKLSPLAKKGIPIVAIHGTHERRVKGLLNPVQALERAGVLIYLHANCVVFEKKNEKVCVQGLSAVPDQYAEAVLQNWNPKPEKGCFNIFLIHQSVNGFVMAEHLLPLEKLPKGFDLYILGHIHAPQKTIYNGKPLIVTGSAVPTQLKKEYIKPAGYWIVETKNTEPVFIEFENQRKAYILEGESKEEIIKKLKRIFSEKQQKKPIVKVVSKLDMKKELEMKFGERALLYFQKDVEELERPELTPEEHKLSVQELGKKFLVENLKKAGLNEKVFVDVFELLLEKETKKAIKTLRENINNGKRARGEGCEAGKTEPHRKRTKKIQQRLGGNIKSLQEFGQDED